MMLAAFAIIICLLAVRLIDNRRHPTGFPPGPGLSLPLLGNVLDIGTNMIDGFEALGERYGGIFGLHIGQHRAVVVSDFHLIQEVGSQANFSSRYHLPAIENIRGQVKLGDSVSASGIVGSDGPNWVEQRRFALHTLKNLGYGRGPMEEMVGEEAGEFCRWLESSKAAPLDFKNTLHMAVFNSLWTLATSKRMEYHDPKIHEIMELMATFMAEIVKPVPAIVFMFETLNSTLTRLNLELGCTKVMRRLVAEMEDIVEEHKRSFEEDHPTDFTDFYLREMRARSASPFFTGVNGRHNLTSTLLDFFMAGIDTTGATLNWACLYLTLHPDIQGRVQEELDSVTQRQRTPVWSDRCKTPYTEAVIHEIQRCSNVVPLAIAHAAAEDGYLGGYFIPKGTWILPHLGQVLMDPNVFPNPGEFNPTRFMDSEGKFTPNNRVIPFGSGKRKCLGENLARMTLYLFLTRILHEFNLAKASQEEELSIERVIGLIVSPKRCKIKFLPRN